MHSVLSLILWLSLISTCRGFDRLVHVADLLHRIIREGLAEDVATTDLYFVNFQQPEYIELQSLVLERLHQSSTVVPMFMNARNNFARKRFLALVGAPNNDELTHSIDAVFYSGMTDQQRLENSLTTHVIAIVLDRTKHHSSKNPFGNIMGTTLGRFRSHNFILMALTRSEARIYTIGRNLFIKELQWNDSFRDLFLNRPFVGRKATNEVFAAVRVKPTVDFRDGHFEGLDVIVFSTIMDHFNLSFKIILVPHRAVVEMGNEFKDLFNRRKIGAKMNRGEISNFIGVSMMIPQQDGLCILTPKSKRKYLFYYMLQPLEPSLWLFLWLFLIVSAFSSALWSSLFHQNLILTLFCGSIRSEYQMQRLERFTFLGCSILLMILFEAYLTKFIFLMTTYRYERDPQTVEEFIESPQMILQLPQVAEHLIQLRSSLESKIITTPSFKYDVSNSSYAYVIHCSMAESLLGEQAELDRFTFGPNRRPAFHLVPEKLETTAIYYTFSQFSFYYANFKLCLDWLLECGLSSYWEKSIERKYYLNPAYEFTDSVVLDLERLLLLWIIYGIGILVSMVAFTVEVVLERIGKWKRLS